MTAETLTYHITRIVLGEPRSIEISVGEFNEIVTAQERLITLLALEEKLDYVLANFADYEGDLLRLALNQLVWPERKYAGFRSAQHLVNRRVVNLLSTTRLYLDQVKHELSDMYGKESAQFATLRARETAAYDSSFAYRFLDALRNHVQHRAMPVHQLSFPMTFEREEDPVRLRYSVVPLVEVEQLRANQQFKAVVLKELASKGDKLELTPLIREYVESICGIHTELRGITDPDVVKWESVVENTRKRAHELFGEDLVGLGVVARRSDYRSVRHMYLSADVIAERRELRAKNSIFANFANRYVSGVAAG